MTKIGFVEGNGFVMDYCCFGSGRRVMVLLPGVSLMMVSPLAEFVAAQYAAVTDDYTVYLFDRRRDIGEGYSVEDMADDTAEAMQRLGISGAYVYGCSQGGMMAQVIAAKYPPLVAKMAVCSTMCSIDDVQAESLGEWAACIEAGDAVALVRRFFATVYSGAFQDSHQAMLSQMEALAPHVDIARVGRLVNACLAFDATALLPQIECETLVIGAEDDAVLGVEPSRRLAQRLACELKVYAGYGHAVYDENPDVLLAVRDFFNRL